MNNFSKLIELEKAKKKYSNNRGYCTKEEYLKAVKDTFNIDAKISDIHHNF